MEVLLPPDVEVGVVAALSSAGVADWVATRYPTDDPGTVVRVSVTGGSVRDVVVTQSQVLVEFWAHTDTEASAGARAAYGALVASVGAWHGGVWFRHVEAALPVNLDDIDRPDRHRYQFVATVHARMEAT